MYPVFLVLSNSRRDQLRMRSCKPDLSSQIYEHSSTRPHLSRRRQDHYRTRTSHSNRRENMSRLQRNLSSTRPNPSSDLDELSSIQHELPSTRRDITYSVEMPRTFSPNYATYVKEVRGPEGTKRFQSHMLPNLQNMTDYCRRLMSLKRKHRCCPLCYCG